MPEGITTTNFFEAWRAMLLSKNYNLSILQDGKHVCFFGFINDSVQLTYTEPDTQKFRLLWFEKTSAVRITSDSSSIPVRRGDRGGNHWQLKYEVVNNQVVSYSLSPMTGDGFRVVDIQGTGKMNMGGPT